MSCACPPDRRRQSPRWPCCSPTRPGTAFRARLPPRQCLSASEKGSNAAGQGAAPRGVSQERPELGNRRWWWIHPQQALQRDEGEVHAARLVGLGMALQLRQQLFGLLPRLADDQAQVLVGKGRSEERRVGKEWRTRGLPVREDNQENSHGARCCRCY